MSIKLLFMDIETFPNKVYSWGLWKQNIAINQIVEPGYTACFAAKWNHHSDIYFDSCHQNSMNGMLTNIWNLLDEADAVVHYNGKKFDIPTLNKEFIQAGLGVPSPYHQIDLYQVVRSQFRFPSNKLDYVSQALGLGAKVKHMGMELWNRCMEGDEKAWRLMERYNKQDVRLLPKLYKRLLPWIKDHPNHALYTDGNRPVCTNCGSIKVQSRGIEHTNTQSYKRYQCSGCGTWMRGRYTVVPLAKRKATLTQVKS